MKIRTLLLAAGALLAAVTNVSPQGNGTVKSHQKITTNKGNFTAELADKDLFGFSAAELGDFDGDGIGDMVVGARATDDGAKDTGAIYILLLNANGTVKSHQRISPSFGGLGVTLDELDNFGFDVTPLGDLDGDGVTDIAVGAPLDDDGGEDRGAVYVLFLNADGTVKRHQKISSTQGGFTGILDDFGLPEHPRWGASLATLGDLNRDGVVDIAVGALKDDGHGTAWILFLNSDGTVKSHQKIGMGYGDFRGKLEDRDKFGISMSGLGDFNRDGTPDLAVGAMGDDDGGGDRGAVWILFLDSDGTVKSHQKISSTAGNFTGKLDDLDHFGTSVAVVPDLTRDGINELVVGAFFDNVLRGAVWVLFMARNGTVKGQQKINSVEGGFTGRLQDKSEFGLSVACPGDLDGDGIHDIGVGAIGDPGTGVAQGAVWMLFLNGQVQILKSYESMWIDNHVEVRWVLVGAGTDVTFDVWRREQTNGYEKISPPIVSTQGEFAFTDNSARPSNNYTYRISVLENGEAVATFETSITTPTLVLSLHQNHPNPFNPSTSIPYTLEKEEAVLLQIFDVSGRLIRTLVDASVAAGDHSEEWDGRDDGGRRVASGAYLIRLQTGGATLTRKATLLR